jgi:hypothetical protein
LSLSFQTYSKTEFEVYSYFVVARIINRCLTFSYDEMCTFLKIGKSIVRNYFLRQK